MNLLVNMKTVALPVLTHEEEKQLFIEYKEHNSVDAVKKLILSHLYVVKRYVRKINYQKRVPDEDLFSEGVIGLMKAIKRFDYTKPYRLCVYAAKHIRFAMLYYLRCNWKITSSNTKKDIKLFFNTEMRDDNATAMFSAHAPIDDFHEILEDENNSIDNAVENNNLEYMKNILVTALDSLPERNRNIINDRYLIENPLSLKEIGLKYGVSPQRIEQIEKSSLSKLRACFPKECTL